MRWLYLKASFPFWFGLVFGVAGVALAGGAASAWLAQRRLDAGAERAAAVVSEKGHDVDRDGTTRLWLRVAWDDGTLGPRSRLEEVAAETWGQVEEGDSLVVAWPAGTPEQARLLPEGGEGPVPLALVLAGAPVGAAGWLLVLLAARRAGGRVALLSTGVAVDGTVEAVELDERVRVNGRHPRVLAFSYRDEVGERRTGRSPHLPRALETRWGPGDRIRVVYDGLDPQRCEPDLFDLRR